MRTLRIALPVLLILGGSALADWPMARHDPQRTGLATGHSDLKTPGAYWRYYLGGPLGSGGSQLLDVDGDGQDELLVIRGGRLVALRQTGTEAWESAPLALVGLAGIADLDGDGKAEAIVNSSSRFFVIDLSKGSTLFSEDPADLGTLGGIRVADVNGDGRADVMVQECGCCGLNNGRTGYTYSFAAGFAAATLLYTMPRASCGGANSLTVFDGDGTGSLETLSIGVREIEVLDAATGKLLADSPDLGDWIPSSACLNAALDAIPGDEIVCYLSSALPQPVGTGHRVMALRYAGGPTPTFKSLWTQDIGDVDAALSYSSTGVGDLDGDGSVEIVVSGETQTGDHVLTVLDGTTGTVLATVSGQRLIGVGPFDTDHGMLILTDTGTGLATLRFRRKPTPTLAVAWTLSDRVALKVRDWTQTSHALFDALPLVDLDGDGFLELLVGGRSSPEILAAVQTHGTPGRELASYSAAVGAQMNGLVLPTGALATGAVFAAPSSDGIAAVLDGALVARSARLRVGSYSAPGAWGTASLDPVIGSLNGSTAIIVSDSRRFLSRIDPANATNIVPPHPTWTVRDVFSPAFVPNLFDGVTGIAARMIDRTTDPNRSAVVALDGTGHERWHVTLGDLVFDELNWGLLDGSPDPSLAVLWGESSDLAVHLSVLAGSTGAQSWTRSWLLGPNRSPVGAAIGDLNGDHHDDIAFQYYGTRILRGDTGADLAVGGPGDAYFQPTIYDVDGDGVPEVTLSGGQNALQTLRADLASTLWASTEVERPYPYAAIVTCPDPMPVPLLASTSYAFPGRIKFTTTSGPTAGAATSMILAGGEGFPDLAAAMAVRAVPGQLTSVYAHVDLGGDGQTVTLVGSSDGWLYAVKPCTRELVWSVQFNAPVGAIAFGDTDGDGLDEVAVSVGDGYLYGLRNAPLAAPDLIWDTDPPDGLVTSDVDVRANLGQLSAAWDPVDGASGYEVAVADADGDGYLTDPAWTSAGSGTSATVAGLQLVAGARYVFAVRAIGPGGRSPDIVSDGVVVTGDPPATPGTAAPGGCCQADHGGPAGPLALLALALVLRSRRRSR